MFQVGAELLQAGTACDCGAYIGTDDENGICIDGFGVPEVIVGPALLDIGRDMAATCC